MKKRSVYLAVLFIIGVLLSACGVKSSGEAASAPTGHPSEEVQRITVFCNGTLYWYMADGFDHPLEQGFEKAGEVSKVDNLKYPEEEFAGTRLDVGQEIYTSQEDSSRVYVKYADGYAVFEKADTEANAVILREDTETEELYFQKDGKDYEKVKDLIDGKYYWASAVGQGENIVDSQGHERPDYYTQPRWFINLDSGESLEVRRWDNLHYSAGDYLIYEYNGTMYVAEKEDLYHPVLSYPVEGTYGIINKVPGGYMVANNKEYRVVYYNEKFQEIRALEGFRAGESGNYYRDGLMAVRDMDTGLMGFLDEKGEVAIPCQYGYVSDFSNGFSSVLVDARLIPYTEDGDTVQMFGEVGGYWAVIDTKGDYAVAPSEAYANKAFGDERDLYCGARRFSEARSDGTIDFLDISQDDKVIETIRIK